MAKNKRVHSFTQWAAQFAVASELCKRGYQVALTMGNHPVVDMMVVSPKGKPFSIDVKGLKSKNPWLIKLKPIQADLFYVLAYVERGQPNQFFILTQDQANRIMRAELSRLERPPDYPVTGLMWKLALPHKDRWEMLPQ